MMVRKGFDIPEVELARAKRLADKAGLPLNRYLREAVIAANDGVQSVERLDEANTALKETIAQLEREISQVRVELQQETAAVVQALEAQNQRVIDDNRTLLTKFLKSLSQVVSTTLPSSDPPSYLPPAP